VELSSDIEKFEFKFINRHDGVIFWERGLNNVVDLKGLIQELKFQKKGRYNKYEYNYNSDVDEITLTCKIKGWE
jgi:Leu/Phe-tRNA-protein transferase